MKKDYNLDFIRVLSMFLVIVIHVSNIYSRDIINISTTSYFFATLFNAIARVAVPLFFMISGALLIGKDHDDEKNYIKRIKKLVITLLSWTIIYYVWDIFIMGYNKPLIATLFRTSFAPIKAHLWFMYALISIYLILPFVRKIFKNTNSNEDKLFIYLWIFFTGIVYVLRLFIGAIGFNVQILYPVPLVQGTYYFGYFVLGHIIYKYLNKVKLNRNQILSIFSINIFIIFIITFIVSIITNKYYEALFAYRSVFYILASSSIMILLLKNKYILKRKVIKFIDYIAPYSFGIYLSHVIFLNIFNRIGITWLNSIFGIPLFSIIIFILSYMLVYLIKKIKYLKEII